MKNNTSNPEAAAVTARARINHRCTSCDHGTQCDPLKSWACPKCGAELVYVGARLATKHTPGPWEFCTGTPETFGAIRAVTGQSGQGSYLGTVGGGDRDIDEANGRLMAAAPELLEASQRLLNYLQGFFHDEPVFADGDDAADVVKELRSAIAKAEGGAL